MTEHTPGPWHLGDNDAVYGAHGKFSAVVADCNTLVRTPETDHANACLISAAPDLLAALRDVLDQLDGIGIPEWHGAEGLCLDAARAAIAKATGGK